MTDPAPPTSTSIERRLMAVTLVFLAVIREGVETGLFLSSRIDVITEQPPSMIRQPDQSGLWPAV